MSKLKIQPKVKDNYILYCRGVDKRLVERAKKLADKLGYKTFNSFINELLKQFIKDNK